MSEPVLSPMTSAGIHDAQEAQDAHDGHDAQENYGELEESFFLLL